MDEADSADQLSHDEAGVDSRCKTHFSRLVARAEQGEAIVIRRGPTPVVKIVAYHPPATPRRPGILKGRITIADGFDEIPPEFSEYLACHKQRPD